jgi:hypothetical protein
VSNVVIFGATSAIAEAVALRFARAGDGLHLFARDAEKLAAVAQRVKAAGAVRVHASPMDAHDIASHRRWIDDASSALGHIDIALLAWGSLGDQRASERDVQVALHELATNATSVIALSAELATYFEARGHGTLAVIGSVAGDRGRGSNYTYGSAKAAVAAYLQGLRARLWKRGVRVVTIKPGPVATPMTAHFDKGLLWSTPERIAGKIHRAIVRGTDVVYVPAWWRGVMLVIRAVPEPWFKRLSL